MPELPFRFYDSAAEVVVTERWALPHWSQSYTVSFITWRTWDSIPENVMRQWLKERTAWLRQHDIDVKQPDWTTRVRALSPAKQKEFLRLVWQRWENALDECHGSCVLRAFELAQIVGDCLRHFDGDRYLITDFVVMPNHVHLLAAFPDAEGLLAQCDSWKHYSAGQINRRLGRSGRFWQADGFDHLVRNEEQFQRLRKYVAENPRKAKLTPGEYLHYYLEKLEWPSTRSAQ